MTTRPASTPPSSLPASDPLVARTRAVWTAGDFDRIASGYRTGAAEFVARVGVRPGESVADLACGTGNLALPAAQAGADVTGLDIAANLLATARRRAAEAGLSIRFEEGNCEDLPYRDASFDTALSMFGVMFAPRPELVARELLRVVRPGGKIALANWTKDGFIGAMLRAHVALVPPPAGVPSTLLWGDEATVRQRLAGVRSLSLTRRDIFLEFPMAPEGVVRLFRDFYGPTVRTFEALDAPGQERLHQELLALWTQHNRATDGTTRVASEYLEVIAER